MVISVERLPGDLSTTRKKGMVNLNERTGNNGTEVLKKLGKSIS